MLGRVEYVVRPIDEWPGELRTDAQRKGAQFTAGWGDTREVLGRELVALGARNVVMQLDVTDRDCRLDGRLRVDARPGHPGVIIAFDSKHGPLKYATDLYNRGAWRREGALPGWQCNVRAIGLGLEALRRVDRYGITQRGEQYTGWKALGAGMAMGAGGSVRPGFTLENAAAFLVEHGEWGPEPGDPGDLVDSPIASELIAAYYRSAATRLHPDVGGDPDLFVALGEARRMLDQHQAAS
jgi:hypothetical protein